MLRHRRAIRATMAAAGCLVLVALGDAPPAPAEPSDTPVSPVVAQPPDPAADAAAPADTGIVVSSPPGIAQTEDGRTITVAAENETQLPIAPLTTALSSRDWLVGGTFTGSTTGSMSGGTLEVGYQIGCGIEMNQIRIGGTLGGNVTTTSISFPISGVIDVRLRPGSVVKAEVMTKEFKGTKSRVIVKDIHVNVDGCVGSSSLRSYAILTSSTAHTEDIVAYYGATKVF
jgi:hypothetical protein